MLNLHNITKIYGTSTQEVHALNDVSISFGPSEFVAILGPSGCGKTTLLNIIGGLDTYTSGDLSINGTSTKEYSAADWDAYRNHSVGFVFQSYNLIPHQSVLANVELALSLSGISAKEQKKRATAALKEVGLADQLTKKPSEMSGGQMQRVAIARALVNNPSIILADEPTGALDSKTSLQIMRLLKRVSKKRLVIMVTHNPELAEQFATRIIRLKDGTVKGDSAQRRAKQIHLSGRLEKPRHTKLSFLAALRLSANNLKTKKGRTFLTSFAGAIGIIGIALIMSLSSGMNAYIQNLETQTMGSYPITLQRTTFVPQMEGTEGVGQDTSNVGDSQEWARDNMSSGGFSLKRDADNAQDPGYLTSTNVVGETFSTLRRAVVKNNLASFKSYLVAHGGNLAPWISGIEYTYETNPIVYREDPTAQDAIRKVNPVSLLEDSSYLGIGSSFIQGIQTSWEQLPSSEQLQTMQYDLCAGQWPSASNEVALVVDESYKVSDFNLYQLGLMDASQMNQIIEAAKNGQPYTEESQTFSYDAVLGKSYSVFSPAQLYQKSADVSVHGSSVGVYVDKSTDSSFVASRMKEIAADDSAGNENAPVSVKIVGVLKAKDAATIKGGGIAYTHNLTTTLMQKSADAAVTQEQLSHPDTNVLTGEAFSNTADIATEFNEGYGSMLSSMMGASYQRPQVRSSGSQEEEVPRYAVATSYLDVLKQCNTDRQVCTANQVLAMQQALTCASQPNVALTANKNASYNVTFLNWDGTTLGGPYVLPEGTAIPSEDIPASPTRPADDAYMYIFFGWADTATGAMYFSQTLPPMSKTTVYQAMFLPVPLPDPEIRAFIQALQAMTPAQRELLLQIAEGKTPNLEALIAAGIISPAALSSFMQQYLVTPEGQALLAGLMPELSNMDAETFLKQYLASLSPEQLQTFFSQMGGMSLNSLFASLSSTTPKTYDAVLSALGYATEENPTSIIIYPKDFEGKKQVENFLQTYNNDSLQDDHVTYTDFVGTMTKGISDIINIISAVLIAFVSIALVVSSIMIAIITWISVLERTKEIGILRALGASKQGVSKIFNAETFIEGLLAGILGIVITLILDVFLSVVIYNVYGAENIAALPWVNACILIGISVLLTLVAGFIPARLAAKKDPVEALRSE